MWSPHSRLRPLVSWITYDLFIILRLSGRVLSQLRSLANSLFLDARGQGQVSAATI
jgi:hypothetical protein